MKTMLVAVTMLAGFAALGGEVRYVGGGRLSRCRLYGGGVSLF